ncbi:MAG: hypothetical protein WEB00_01610 [Dehalococcoidia bacterium]
MFGLTLVSGCGGGDEDKPEDRVAADLERIAEAFNDGDSGRLYNDFMAVDCRRRLSVEEAEERFAFLTEGADLAIEKPERIEIGGDVATVRANFTATADERQLTASDTFEMVFEDDHWRFSDCFGAEL